MNYRIIGHFLGLISLIVGFCMLFSLPWAFVPFGGDWNCEGRAFLGLALSAGVSFCCGGVLLLLTRRKRASRDDSEQARTQFYRRDSLVIVAFSWILATVLCALPYLLSHTYRATDTPMSVADALFEAQSGLSTTGSSVLAELENPILVPRCILFWRSTTHFLGGVGFMTLFVVLLGYGNSGGKTLMRMEQTKAYVDSQMRRGNSGRKIPLKPLSDNRDVRIREATRIMLWVYVTLNATLATLLWLYGVPLFDSLCHAFSTIATGGFSTYQNSIGHFASATDLNAPLIEYTITFFMFVSGTSFLLIYLFAFGIPGALFRDIEWLTYAGIVAAATLLVFGFGLWYGDFASGPENAAAAGSSGIAFVENAFRASLFQVVSIMTTTGYVTERFETWNALSLMVFVLLMIVGGCSGSTAGGSKVIRSILSFKSLGMELERTWRPNVVRNVFLGKNEVDRETITGTIFFMFLFVAMIVFTAFVVLLIEPNAQWTANHYTPVEKLVDISVASLSMFSNVGPSLGVCGADGNYGGFTEVSKIVFAWAMLLGRLEILTILTLCMPSFWKNH